MASNYNLFFAKGGPFAKMKNEKEQIANQFFLHFLKTKIRD